MDYSYYSINQVPLVTYGMIGITTALLVTVSMSESGGSDSGAAEGPAAEQYGGSQKHKTRGKRTHNHKISPKRRK